MADAPGRVYTRTCAFCKGQSCAEEDEMAQYAIRYQHTQQQNPETQRNGNKVQERCVSDLLRLLVVLVEKFPDPAGVVWMDRLQVLNLHKPENNDKNLEHRMSI